MRIKTVVLGGIAIAALCGTGMVAPASAYTRHPGTPAEHRQTEDLNQQQLEKAQAQEQATTQASAATNANQQANASPTTPSSSEQASTAPGPDMQANAGSTEQSNTASNMQANAAPGGQAAGGEQAGAPNAAPAGNVTQTASGTPVDSLSNPPQALANASVETSNGQAVGAVQRVIMDASGRAKSVVVSLLGKMNKLVEIAANQLSFDESRNVVVAQMDADQINALPPAPQG
jgi:hypothetical protein